MFQDALSIHKLIILHMLNRVDFPLTKAQIMDFLLGRDYLSYITFHQVMDELAAVEFIQMVTYNNRTHLVITDEGAEVLALLGQRIGAPMRAEIEAFFRENELKMRNEVSVLSEYQKSTSGEYEARLMAKDNGITLVDITLSVPDEAAAKEICDNWQKKHQAVYKYLVETLF